MHRYAVAGLAIVAILALSVTATAVDSGLNTGSVGLPGGSEEPAIEAPEQDPAASGEQGAGSDSNHRTQGDTSERVQTTEPALWQILTSMILVTVGGLVILYGLTRGEHEETIPKDTETSRSRPDETVDSPSTACNRPPTNDVYRVWRRLHREVCDDATTRSPAEVATRAIEAGFDEEAVETLSREFCLVRYGWAAPTEKRERQARAVGETLGLLEDRE